MISPTLRRPSDRTALYAWHRDALEFLDDFKIPDLAHGSTAHIDADLLPKITEEPQCGYYKARVTRRAALVPAKIFVRSVVGEDGELLEPESFRCDIGDREFDVMDTWLKLCIRPITAGEYQYLMAVRAWAQESAPDQPQAVDGRPIDWMTVQIPQIPASAPPKRKARA